MADQHVVTLFTDRHGGASRAPYDEKNLAGHVGDRTDAVHTNRRALESELGAPVVWMHQVHGDRVAVVHAPKEDDVEGVDALVTASDGLALAVLVADCIPLLMSDRHANLVAAVHVGRRGLVSRTALRTLTVMAELGGSPEATTAWIGPSICGSCYEVPAVMRDDVETAAPGSAATTRTGTPSVDLRAGLRRQLRDAGLTSISDLATCTAESSDHFSYRRDGVTGRFAGVIVQSRAQVVAP